MTVVHRLVVVVVLVLAAGWQGACVGKYKSDFQVSVVNRTVNTLTVLANDSSVGQVTAGNTSTFSLSLTESNANVYANGIAPTPQAEVVLTAKDARTGALSTAKTITLSQGTPTQLAITLTNNNFTALTGAGFTDTLPSVPGQIRVANPPNASTTCGGTFAPRNSSELSTSSAGESFERATTTPSALSSSTIESRLEFVRSMSSHTSVPA